MKLKAVLFDLDGTLLPMDMDVFVNGYFKFLVKKMIPHGYEPDLLIKSVWKATGAMVANDGSCTNEEAFWKAFCGIYGEKALQDRSRSFMLPCGKSLSGRSVLLIIQSVTR